MKWLNSLKLAVINKDIESIGKLIGEFSNVDELDKAKETLALVNEAILIVEQEKQKTLEIMNKIRQTKAFLKNH